MKIIYVDDEKLNLDRFEMIISRMDTKHELFTFKEAETALDFAKENQLDIAFLDIEMQEKDGIWLAKQLAILSIPFAFVTAHQGYAVEAFSLSAIHYIIKPVTQKSVLEVLNRMEEIKSKTNISDLNKQLKILINKDLPHAFPKKIFVKNRFKVSILSLSNVLYFEASGSYTKIKSINGEGHVSSKLLRTYEELLVDHPNFLRIHRAFLINTNHVIAVIRNENRTSVKLIDDTELEISPTLKDTILDLLKI